MEFVIPKVLCSLILDEAAKSLVVMTSHTRVSTKLYREMLGVLKSIYWQRTLRLAQQQSPPLVKCRAIAMIIHRVTLLQQVDCSICTNQID
jgi:hypothetical protein